MGSAQQTVTAPAGSIVSSQLATAFPSASLDMNGTELILDADADTSITADTDDRVDIKIGGSDIAHVTSTGVGIGTSSPSHELHITGSSDTRAIITSGGTGDAVMMFENASGNTWGHGLDVSSTEYVVGYNASGDPSLTTNAKLSVDTDGNFHVPDVRFRTYTNGTTGFSVSTPSNGNSIVDTNLTANEYGTYLISLYARPNPGGSSIYSDQIAGILSCTGSYNSGAISWKIKFTELYNHSADSNTDITLSFVLHDGSGGEATTTTNGNHTIRAKVGGQATGYEFSGARLIFYQLNAGSV
tara:strand:- start:347 stop:1246 length:900 start_codon:yes stop_codon:yes gene_type:complete